MKRCGEIWSKFSDKEKKKYNDLHDKDVKRYDKQLMELHKKGFFIMNDGSKSSDHQAKIKKKRDKATQDSDSESEKKAAKKKVKK